MTVRFDGQTNLLHPSTMTFEDKPPSGLATPVLRLLAAVGLTKLKTQPQDGMILEASNLTILNVFLVRLGPMTEKRLVQTLIGTQVSALLMHFLPPTACASLPAYPNGQHLHRSRR